METAATVLFVDDEPAILQSLRRLFRPQGYRVLVAESGSAALALLAAEPVDLVVSDMRMPQMDGAQFLEQVRERWPQAQRLLLTGYADIASTIAAINRGAIHRYIAKPWDDQELLLAVREGLDRSRLAQENRRLQALTQAQNAELSAANATLEARVQARTAELAQVNDMLQASYAELERSFLLSLDVFAGLLELREPGKAGLSRAVARRARAIAAELGLPPREQQDAEIAGLLHGIGHFSLPDALLVRPLWALGSDDQARVHRHPLAGEAALLPLTSLQRPARWLRHQFERIDGLGGPDGLAGAEFPLGAQAVSLAVEYESLLAGRLSALRPTPAEAQQRIAGLAGTHWLPAVVAAFQRQLARQAEQACAARRVDAAALQPDMVLAHDLLSPQGSLLLAKGFRFDERSVRQVREFQRRLGSRLQLLVEAPAAVSA